VGDAGGPRPLLAGVDVGTTSVKAAVFDPAGRPVASAAVPTPTRSSAPGRAEYDPEALWQAAATALRRAVGSLPDADDVAGVAVASMAEAGVAIDRDGVPVAPIVAWYDRRSAAQGHRLVAAVGAERLRALTGLPPQPIYGICKIMWLAENAPEPFARAHTWLNVADYIAYRLSDERATDFSLATRTGALDLRARRWSGEVLDAAGIPVSLFPTLVASGTALGRVTSQAADETGLPPHTVVGAGGHDHICGSLAAGVVDPGRALDSIGTAESLLLPLAAPLATDDGTPRFSQGIHVAGDRSYAAAGIHAGGASIDWVLRLLAGAEDADALLSEAAAVPAGARGVVFAPHVGAPGVVDGKAGALIGLTPDIDRATVVRAVMEGLAVVANDLLDRLVEQAALASRPEVRVIGGGARNALLLSIKAAVAGRPLHRLQVREATSLGAALLGGVAAGTFPDATTAAAGIEMDLREVAPDAADYDAPARRVRALRDLFG